jgi:hypothetical protein
MALDRKKIREDFLERLGKLLKSMSDEEYEEFTEGLFEEHEELRPEPDEPKGYGLFRDGAYQFTFQQGVDFFKVSVSEYTGCSQQFATVGEVMRGSISTERGVDELLDFCNVVFFAVDWVDTKEFSLEGNSDMKLSIDRRRVDVRCTDSDGAQVRFELTFSDFVRCLDFNT